MLKNCSADTLFGKADDKLSRMCTSLAQLAQARSECYEDVQMWHAPSECYDSIDRSYNVKERQVFEDADMDYIEFHHAITLRTSERWTYYNLPIYARFID